MSGRRNLNTYALSGYQSVTVASGVGTRLSTLKLPRAWAILGLQLTSGATQSSIPYPVAKDYIGYSIVAYTDAATWQPTSGGVTTNVLMTNLFSQSTEMAYSAKDCVKVGADQPVSLYVWPATGFGTITAIYSAVFYTYFIEQ